MMTEPIPDFALGSDKWPGLAKLNEECGELVQVIGKIMAHPSPDEAKKLHDRLIEEMADVDAAIDYVIKNNKKVKGKRIDKRRKQILERRS